MFPWVEAMLIARLLQDLQVNALFLGTAMELLLVGRQMLPSAQFIDPSAAPLLDGPGLPDMSLAGLDGPNVLLVAGAVRLWISAIEHAWSLLLPEMAYYRAAVHVARWELLVCMLRLVLGIGMISIPLLVFVRTAQLIMLPEQFLRVPLPMAKFPRVVPLLFMIPGVDRNGMAMCMRSMVYSKVLLLCSTQWTEMRTILALLGPIADAADMLDMSLFPLVDMDYPTLSRDSDRVGRMTELGSSLIAAGTLGMEMGIAALLVVAQDRDSLTDVLHAQASLLAMCIPELRGLLFLNMVAWCSRAPLGPLLMRTGVALNLEREASLNAELLDRATWLALQLVGLLPAFRALLHAVS